MGETREREFWRCGWTDWETFLEACRAGREVPAHVSRLAPEVQHTLEQFQAENWRFFDRVLPASCKWRAYGELRDKAVYLDIETEGGAAPEAITIIGIWDGREERVFISGDNLEDALEVIEAYPLVVTFCGTAFDMPLLRARFRYHAFNHIHLDLRSPLKRLGLTGGLKRIERALGIARSEETQGLDGWDAMRLWEKYQRGAPGALELLIKYNLEDAKNLAPLAEFAYSHLRALELTAAGIAP